VKAVLLLDDDPDLRALLRTSLLARGLQVVEASRARDAEALIQKAPVDVAVVDGLLRDGTGLEFVERVRAHNRAIRIVFISAYYRDLDTFRRLTALDVSRVAYKPVDPESFAAQIAELLDAPVEPPPGPELAQQLEQLHRQFHERLPGKITEVENAVAAAKADAQHMARARDLAHALRGSAGSYGFPSVSEAIAVVEYLLTDASTRGPSSQPFFWEQIAGALRDAQRAALAGR